MAMRPPLQRQTTLVPMAPAGRISRRPQHRFTCTTAPWVISPFMIAPVLPGETLQNLLLQASVETNQLPAANRKMGWWHEMYFFYVKHRDLDERDEFTNMVLSPQYDLSALFTATASPMQYCYAGTVNWLKKCTKRIVEEYFRDEGELWDDFQFDDDNHVIAGISMKNFFQSLILDADLIAPADVAVDPAGGIMASEIEAAMRQYEWAKMNNLTQMTYEDFLGTYGVRTAKIELHRPELIRFVREWSMPSMKVDPSAPLGGPGPIVSWTIQERADKERFFREPGFIVGLSVTRPKVYLAQQQGAGVGLLTTAYSWLPAVLRDDPLTSLIKQPESGGISPVITGPYWVDARDLFVHGDQFIGTTSGSSAPNAVQLPDPSGNAEYASKADMVALFADDTAAGDMECIHLEGIVTLNVLGTQVDQTP